MYPVHADACINSFEAKILTKDGKPYDTINVEIEEKQAARTTFKDARESDRPAVLAELDDMATDSFTVHLGAIPAGHVINVHFSYLLQLSRVSTKLARSSINKHTNRESYRLFIPMIHKQRYVPNNGKQEPEHNAYFSMPAKFKMYIKCMPKARNITGKMSARGENGPLPREITKIPFGGDEKWIVSADQIKQYPEDIELYIEIDLPGDLSIGHFDDFFTCTEDEALYVMHLKPDFNKINWKKQHSKEYVFVIDRSGSMYGESIEQAKQALKLLVKSLPITDPPCKFNIYSFGSRFEKHWPENKPYDDDNVADAEKHIDGMSADFGGTELLQPVF